MIIRKQAIRNFLHRELPDFRSCKSWTNSEIEQELSRLPVHPPIWHRLKRHQKVCFLLGAQQRNFAFFMDTGTGKTLLSIALARYFRKAGISYRSLVLVPRRVNKGEWAREIQKHSPKTRFVTLGSKIAGKWETLRALDSEVMVIETYAGLARMVCNKVKKKGKNRLKPDRKLVSELCGMFNALYLDESTEIKSKASLPFRICRQLAKRSPVRFALTGTPFGRDPSDLWAQMFVVDNGATLGPTLGLFRAVFFTAKVNYWGGIDYTFNKRRMEPALNRILAARSLRYEADAADLPRVSRIRKEIILPDDAEQYYNRAKAKLLEARGNIVERRNAFLRMRQISSGFLGYEDDETGAKAEFEFDDNPKLELLLSILETIDHKAIVFNDFVHSGEVIASKLKELGIRYLHVYGRTKDPIGAIAQFNADPAVRVLVLNNSMVLGLNVQVAKYGIFYESPVPVITRKQAERRIERQYSEHGRVFLYDLVVRGTVDERILHFHKEGKDLFKAIVDGNEVL